MIGRLHGVLLEKDPPHLLIDVQGVGYELDAPMSTVIDLPTTGAEVTLHTHLVVREDAQSLFGFLSLTERNLFRSLIRISGVGPKMALALLSGMSAEDLIRCVENQDAALLTRLPGIGKKTAERLVIELRDRVSTLPARATSIGQGSRPKDGDARADAVSGLVALGYKPAEASRLLRDLPSDGLASDELIRQALQKSVR
ncbi:Holliday junction branch migration protein RuvA [Methylonatrum kenyense]|uniref:Holliday junction branch migration protein RuvA n=1 Tax=Methylonatrum kenyense TaxID=455253 RepID=UPI0020C001A4|nr:Holliday junction branch migration protein RuvA [Methylonatrum kenyense]MCK8516182.1 Holliday junction branch migration protein RuvA [Methylonatrum kenyense]